MANEGHVRLGCAIFVTFFICFEANLCKHGSYSLNIRMFWFICINMQNKYIFSYWQIFVLEANIRKTFRKFHIQAYIYLQIFTYQRILACKNLYTSEYLLANIRIPANFRFVLLQIIKESISQS